MKFNDKELSRWSTMFNPDKEGLLDKKGAGKGQGYRQRWFRLKGNLLFYFKVDEYGGWEHSEPVGLIILERCHVDRIHSDTRPHTFVLQFENDDSRTYFLSAYSEVDLEGWIIAIKLSSYEGLRNTLYELQTKLINMTGQDPLKDKGVSIIGSQISPSRKPVSREAKRSVYARSSNKVRAQKLSSLAVIPSGSEQQFELSLSCVNLLLGREGQPPTTMVRVRSYANVGDTSALATLSHTEVIEKSSSPNYSHLILLDISSLHPGTSVLEFEVFSVNHKRMDSMSNCTLKLNSTDSEPETVVLKSQAEDEQTVNLRMGKIIGKATCMINALTSKTKNNELKLPLSVGNMVCGFLLINVQQVEESCTTSQKQIRRNAIANPIEMGSPNGVLPTVLCHPIRCHFIFPTGEAMKMKVFEEMYECIFNVQVPIELLKCYKREDTALLNELLTVGALESQWLDKLQEHQTLLDESIAYYSNAIKKMEDLGDTCGFKSSLLKRDESLRFIPCNLHLQRMRVHAHGKAGRSYSFLTFGCPADHVGGFKSGGLKRLLSECRSSPSFICKWTEGKATSVKQTAARLAEIKSSIYIYNNALYRACANAIPHDMNEAMTGISKQIQLLLWLMESKVVRDAIDGLIMARPSQTLGKDLASMSKEMKRMSLRRKASLAAGGKCTCGKCTKCIPSPSDWIWNGSKFVQTSKEWMMSDSISSIQSDLVTLIDLVEIATHQVVDQQHLAVASEVGHGLSTFKPTYVWSVELIPLCSKLNQTLEGLFRVASTSLSFELVQLDSYVKGIKTLKLRRDVVFSQALTSLVTSFYTTLSQNFTDPSYFKQIRSIGFFAQFESLLSSVGDESGMLEDMCVAVAELATVKFQFVEFRSEDCKLDFQIKGSRDSLVVQFLVSPEIISVLPDESVRLGELISVVPVVFTQGVNEKQTLANIKHDLYLASSVQLQDDVNSQSLDVLCSYVEKFLELVKGQKTPQSKLRAVRVEDLFNHLKKTYSSQKFKNIEFLIALQQLVHWIRGGRLTSCKSGKDRTSMSVTLEECCVLRNNHHLSSSDFSKTLSTLRSHGTRLENCLKNTGHRCYHFNQLQLVLLPKLLTPPPFTCRDPE